MSDLTPWPPLHLYAVILRSRRRRENLARSNWASPPGPLSKPTANFNDGYLFGEGENIREGLAPLSAVTPFFHAMGIMKSKTILSLS
jgi:hypothetical protein